MGTPLFKSTQTINKLSNIEFSKEYLKSVNKAIESGFAVDKSNNDKDKKKYLFELRELQKQYNKFLHQLHKNIEASIKDKDYDTFYELISYELDGLLNSRALLKRSIEFYKANKNKKRSEYLDKKINYKKMIKASSSVVYTKVTKATYNPSNKGVKNRSVDLFVKKSSKYIAVFARNKNPYSITINVKGEYKNLGYADVAHTFSLKPDSTKEYIKLYKRNGSYTYSFSYSWIKGSMDAKHDDSYQYRLPFARGTSKVVSQGYNGSSTHKGASSYAVDFIMDIGTKIYAARGGVVVDVKEDSNKVGYSESFAKHGNFVTIEHDDATFATYYHLKKFGAYVKVGESVNRGDLIGYSGNTGYSSGPHLHFQVYKTTDARSTESIPVKFLTDDGVIIKPKNGSLYTAK
ncbi:peptidase M23B [Sulfurimonas gotlandica GD1]|uniref:Peptidase M23B n=2 Tax=Sulfurimonas TaxID=202746 RepID=B6BNK2_SULGG|nr:peptidase M23B [Sulfurimonas gotlandica GD1]EHP31075.1 peptidase M23B [Sulfurimonas gotlandica GD1]